MASSNDAPKSAQASKTNKGLFSTIITVIMVLLFSLFMSVIIEWIGMAFDLWEIKGAAHALNNLTTELNWVNEDFVDAALFGLSPADMIAWLYANLYGIGAGAGETSPSAFVAWLNSPAENWLDSIGKVIGTNLREYLLAGVYITMLFVVRMSILTLSIPVFILFAAVGLVDGLVQRDLRRWSGGRESGMMYHYAKKFIVPSFLAAWIIYLSVPWSIHPNLITLPFAALTAYTIQTTARTFKKYL